MYNTYAISSINIKSNIYQSNPHIDFTIAKNLLYFYNNGVCKILFDHFIVCFSSMFSIHIMYSI